MVDIRSQLTQLRANNQQLETALGTGALAKKSIIAQSYSDTLWTDPVSGKTYKRFPVTITQYASSNYLTLRDGSAGSTINVFEYRVPEGAELQFLPFFASHYILGRLSSSGGSASFVNDYETRLEGWDQDERVCRGVIWSGISTDINNSSTAMQYGHPLSFNGGQEVRLIGGDLLILKIVTPTGGTAVEMTPASCGISSLAVACYKLTEMRQGA
jgi:hypothetical protein